MKLRITDLLIFSLLFFINPDVPANPVVIRMNDTGFGDGYYGEWVLNKSVNGCYNKDLHSSSKPGSYVEYYFTGTTIKWIGTKDKDHGFADVYIDDVLMAGNIDTHADSCIRQQVLFEKTDLPAKQHKIKIVVKSMRNRLSENCMQTIDAFEFTKNELVVDSRPVGPKYVKGGSLIPKPVPFYGEYEKYFIGNGIAGAGGNVEGTWDFLIGPDYSSSDFLNYETISLIIDGKPQTLRFQMHRGEKSGLYYGVQRIKDLNIYLIDITNNNSSWVSRVIKVDNSSGTNSHKIQVKGIISPQSDHNSKILNREAIAISREADKNLNGWKTRTTNWTKREVHITFSEPCTANRNGAEYEIVTHQREVQPGADYYSGLYHYVHYDEGHRGDFYINSIRSRKPMEDLQRCIGEWRNWISSGNMYSKKIRDKKVQNVIEDILVSIKMQQNRDGGLIATARKYPYAYIRDSHGAARMLLITGHTAEVKKLIRNIHHKWGIAGFIPNYWSMGSDAFIGRSFNNDASEITALYTFMIRDYYKQTGDIVFVDSIYSSLKYSIDAQIDFMSKNGWKIDFNGDETERYCVHVDGMEYGPNGNTGLLNWNPKNWSFASSCEAVASIRYFIDYLNQKGSLKLASVYATSLANIKNAIDSTYWRTDLIPNMHDWSKIRTDSTWQAYRVINFSLIPLWVGAELNNNRQNDDVLAIKAFVNDTKGYLALAPGSTPGMCGNTLPYLLYCLKKLNDPMAKSVFDTIMNTKYLSCWGTVSEYYGPNGTPNGHNMRVFESGILGEAIIRYFIGFKEELQAKS